MSDCGKTMKLMSPDGAVNRKRQEKPDVKRFNKQEYLVKVIIHRVAENK